MPYFTPVSKTGRMAVSVTEWKVDFYRMPFECHFQNALLLTAQLINAQLQDARLKNRR